MEIRGCRLPTTRKHTTGRSGQAWCWSPRLDPVIPSKHASAYLIIPRSALVVVMLDKVWGRLRIVDDPLRRDALDAVMLYASCSSSLFFS